MAVFLLFFIFFGLEPLASGLSQRDNGMAVFGGLILLFSLLIGAAAGNISRLVVTPEYLEYRYGLSTKVVLWAEVESFDVGRIPGRKYVTVIPYPTVVIHLTDGSEVLTRMAGFTAKYPTRIVRELTAWQRHLAPARRG